MGNPETRRPGFRANGHGHAFTSDSVEAAAPPPSLQAGSDDASGTSVAIAASNEAAGADREAYAAPAGFSASEPGSPNGKKRHSPRSTEHDGEKSRVPSEFEATQAAKRPSGEASLPADPAAFVEEIHQRIDLFEIWQELLESEDEKIKQRAVEKLTEMRYKGVQSLAEEPQQILIDLVRPKREA